METIERIDIGSKYMQQSQKCPVFVIKESVGMEYSCVAVLLRNLGEKKDTTSLEREALAVAVRLIKRDMEAEKLE